MEYSMDNWARKIECNVDKYVGGQPRRHVGLCGQDSMQNECFDDKQMEINYFPKELLIS